MNSAEAALRSVEENDRKHSVQCEGNPYVIPFHMDDQSVIVKLNDLSADISDKDIAGVMSKFGKIASIRESE
ncbi:hypothetical protein ZHAS_00015353 [Anopheles sinensis]|uniref:Uncharacterized protein n=1 Tax=Anopheles sinensis TaxID=74873 RepID=A0A084WAS4_ANOSI|nr:hypothetical protein ZHAS_00015353 [Anopheles sinensis]